MCLVRSPPLRNSKGHFVKKKDKVAESEKSEEIIETADPPTTAMDAAAFMEAVDCIIRENREAAERTARENREVAQEDRRMFLEMVERTRQPAAEAAPTLKPSEIYLFKPTNRQDEKSARIFIERITDAQKTYKDHIAKLAMLLSRSLDNEVAHTWYSALSQRATRIACCSPRTIGSRRLNETSWVLRTLNAVTQSGCAWCLSSSFISTVTPLALSTSMSTRLSVR